ncbi:MAG: hypothetical protein CVU39_00505 [Chloroflexi bacterium HGW-Chloroflexi-10]|nr:MAG: hypothetical protein CVU39_00505 [Chloroflexi bacterium HGW-Chloroflexi-10]
MWKRRDILFSDSLINTLIGSSNQQPEQLNGGSAVFFCRSCFVSGELLNDPDPVKAQRVMQAMLQMTKVDIEKLYLARGQNIHLRCLNFPLRIR